MHFMVLSLNRLTRTRGRGSGSEGCSRKGRIRFKGSGSRRVGRHRRRGGRRAVVRARGERKHGVENEQQRVDEEHDGDEAAPRLVVAAQRLVKVNEILRARERERAEGEYSHRRIERYGKWTCNLMSKPAEKIIIIAVGATSKQCNDAIMAWSEVVSQIENSHESMAAYHRHGFEHGQRRRRLGLAIARRKGEHLVAIAIATVVETRRRIRRRARREQQRGHGRGG